METKLGKSTWYVTDRSHAVVLVSDSETAIVSPDDVDGFIAAVGKSGAIPAPTSTMFASPEAAPGGSVPGWIRTLVPIAIAGVVAASLFYAPGPPAYTLTRDSLTIHDRFYPFTLNAARVDVGGVRVISFDKDPDWKPVIRTNGFGNLRYHAGWFRVSSGKEVRMYRAGGSRLVLLPPKGNGTPVLLETRDPDGFVAAVKREWG